MCFDSLTLRRRVRGSSPRLFMPCFACRGSRWGQCFAFRSPFQSRKRLPSKPSCGVSKKRRRVFEKTRLLSKKNSPVFGTLFSPYLAVVGSSEDRFVEGEFSFHKVKSRSHNWHFRALQGVAFLSVFSKKATAKNAHFLVCCAKHSAFSRERHKYALSCS